MACQSSKHCITPLLPPAQSDCTRIRTCGSGGSLQPPYIKPAMARTQLHLAPSGPDPVHPSAAQAAGAHPSRPLGSGTSSQKRLLLEWRRASTERSVYTSGLFPHSSCQSLSASGSSLIYFCIFIGETLHVNPVW